MSAFHRITRARPGLLIMSDNELAWLSGLIGGHAVIGFVVAVILKLRRTESPAIIVAVGVSVVANALLGVGLAAVESSISIANGIASLQDIVVPTVMVSIYMTAIFSAIGVGPSIIGFLAGRRLIATRHAKKS